MNEYDPGAARRSGPPADLSTGIVPSGQPLVGPAAGREFATIHTLKKTKEKRYDKF